MSQPRAPPQFTHKIGYLLNNGRPDKKCWGVGGGGRLPKADYWGLESHLGGVTYNAHSHFMIQKPENFFFIVVIPHIHTIFEQKLYILCYIHVYACTHIKLHINRACTHIKLHINLACTHIKLHINRACTHIKLHINRACTHIKLHINRACTHIKLHINRACTHIKLHINRACTHIKLHINRACTHINYILHLSLVSFLRTYLMSFLYTFDLLLIYTCHFAEIFSQYYFLKLCISQFDILGQPSL